MILVQVRRQHSTSIRLDNIHDFTVYDSTLYVLYNSYNLLSVNISSRRVNAFSNNAVSATSESKLLANPEGVFFNEPHNNRVKKSSHVFFSGFFNIYTFAGGGNSNSENILATSAQLSNPLDIAVNDSDIFILDAGNNRIAKVNATGYLSTFVNLSQLDTPPTTSFDTPSVIAISGEDLFIADSGNNHVFKLCVNASNC